MELDLERIRALTERGQWSVDDFDWSQPLSDRELLSLNARREAGLALLFTAILERQAAYVFGKCADHIDDSTASAIYRLFEADELRHAEAEVRLAARYGVTWDHVPLGVRGMMKLLARERRVNEGRRVFEFGGAFILLFELALDTILLPALKKLSKDPLQAEVFQRIDTDESRHLAMDYWLLEERGRRQKGMTMAELVGANRSLRSRAVQKARAAQTLGTLALGFGSMAFTMTELRSLFWDADAVARYVELVERVPKKAPHALDVPAYRLGLAGQERILKMISFFKSRAKAAA